MAISQLYQSIYDSESPYHYSLSDEQDITESKDFSWGSNVLDSVYTSFIRHPELIPTIGGDHEDSDELQGADKLPKEAHEEADDFHSSENNVESWEYNNAERRISQQSPYDLSFADSHSLFELLGFYSKE